MESKEALKIISYDILVEKPVFSKEEHIEAYKQIEKVLEVLGFIKTQLLLNGDLLLTEFGQDKFRNIIEHWKREMEK